MDHKKKKRNIKESEEIIIENSLDLDKTEENPGISYEIIGKPSNNAN